ncbi:MAG: hypothetical protein L3J91_02525 [Thermoplasmata archaeon]|nr:hypothetical protein [Thermoplasmata archaeon]
MGDPRPACLLLAAALAFALVLPTIGVAEGTSPTARAAEASQGVADDVGRVPSGALTHALPSSAVLHLTLTLRPSDPLGLQQLLSELADLSSPGYRHYQTYREFVDQFSPTPSAVATAQSYFAASGGYGFRTSTDRFALQFELPAGDASRALGLSFVSFAGAGGGGFTGVGAPQLPPTLSGEIAAITGLSGVVGHRAASVIGPVAPSAVKIGSPDAWVTDGAGAGEPWFLGSDFASAFHLTDLLPPSTAVANATFPNRTAVATILMSGYNASTDSDLPPYDPVVVQAYFNDTFPTAWPHPNVTGVPVNVSGMTPPVPGYFGTLNDTTANSIENSLDLEMAGSTAPGATLVNFYFSASLFSSPRFTESLPQIADGFGECLASALSYNYAPARLAAVSGSFGLSDLNDTLWNTELQIAAATGVTVIAASGDQGNAPNEVSGRFQGPWPTWPGSAAFNTYGDVAVGGTTVSMNGMATQVVGSNQTLNATFDASVTGLVSNTAWFDALGGFGNLSGTEGGVSPVYPEPSWQLDSAAQPAIVNATLIQGFGSLGRSEPDVAFPANTTVAYVARDAGGIYYEVVEGTSIAAPLFAGMVATWSAVSGHLFGYLDPELYRIASYFASLGAVTPATPDAYLDVTSGSNYVFVASDGWDPLTGWGSLDSVAFLGADANASIRGYVYTGPTPGLPPPLMVSAGTLDEYLIVIAGVSIAAIVVIVLTVATRRPPSPPTLPYPPGAVEGQWSAPPAFGQPLPQGPAGTNPGSASPAPNTFLCPYCGSPRPAEPVRCPACGRL